MKVGDRIMVLGRERAGEILSKEIGIWGEFFKVKVKDGGIEYFWPFQVELIKPEEETKGQCLPDAVQSLYTALVNLIQVAELAEKHLITHPYQRALLSAIYTAKRALEEAENGKCEDSWVDLRKVSSKIPLRAACPVCHTNHEV